MIQFKNVDVMNFHNAIRGIRNSWDSTNDSDSGFQRELKEINEYYAETKEEFVLGKADKMLAKKLAKAGASHAKYLRQILVSVDIDAPLYWWKQFDQYKVGTTTNSESTMHTIQRKSFLINDEYINYDLFSLDDFFLDEINDFKFEQSTYQLFSFLEELRIRYNVLNNNRNTKKEAQKYWRLLIQLLPSGFNQVRTTTLNYAVLSSIYHDRKNHKLEEWHTMCEWIESLPYSEIITGDEQ